MGRLERNNNCIIKTTRTVKIFKFLVHYIAKQPVVFFWSRNLLRDLIFNQYFINLFFQILSILTIHQIHII